LENATFSSNSACEAPGTSALFEFDLVIAGAAELTKVTSRWSRC